LSSLPVEFLFNSQLLGMGAAALHEHAQHNGEQYTGNNPDDCDCVHCESPFLKCFRPERWIRRLPVLRLVTLDESDLLCCLAPALNQDCEHNNKKHAAYDANDQDVVHFRSPFLEDPFLLGCLLTWRAVT
jgi:hypothetical protein